MDLTIRGFAASFAESLWLSDPGHVEDAQRLTEKYGDNPEVWEDVSYWLLQKSTQQYSTDEVMKFGFCRGLEPVNYVSHILDRFDHYKQFVVT